MTFGPSSNPDYEVQATHGAETIFLSHDPSLGASAVRARVVTNLGTRDHVVQYNPDTKSLLIPETPSIHGPVRSIIFLVQLYIRKYSLFYNLFFKKRQRANLALN